MFQIWSDYSEKRNTLEELLSSEFDLDLMMANMQREDATQYLNVGYLMIIITIH